MEASSTDLRPRSDLTFRTLDSAVCRDISAQQSILNGMCLRNSQFENVDFGRCDLEQIQILNCEFKNCDFGNIELTSAVVTKTRFINCRFDDALISECTFSHTSFEDCTFAKAAVQYSDFDACEFVAGLLRGASFQLDVFRKSRFTGLTLGDCTFLNHLMEGCVFENIKLNAESVGALFGITEEDLLKFGLVYLGERVVDVRSSEGLIAGLEKEYLHRKWGFLYSMLRLNFGRVPVIVGLREALGAILWPATLGIPIKLADLSFFETVVRHLFEKNDLPGFFLAETPTKIREFIRKTNVPEPFVSRLLELAARLDLKFVEALHTVSKALPTALQSDRAVIARLYFDDRPNFKIARLLSKFAKASELGIRSPTEQISSEKGSYVAVVKTTLFTLVSFQIGLWLLNGCMIQLLELKSRVQMARQRRVPKAIRDRTLLPEQHVPKWISAAIQSMLTSPFLDRQFVAPIAKELESKRIRRIEFKK